MLKGKEKDKILARNKILENQAKTLTSVIAHLQLNLQTSERKNTELEQKIQELENKIQNLVFEKQCLQKQLYKTTEDSAPVPKERASGSKTLETRRWGVGVRWRRLIFFVFREKKTKELSPNKFKINEEGRLHKSSGEKG